MPGQPQVSGAVGVQTALDVIGAQARLANQARVNQLSVALTKLGRGELTLLECQRSVQVAHQLVGSAGTFGYARVSELGRQLESLFASGAPGDAGRVAEAAQALVRMQQDLASSAEMTELK